MLFAEKGENFNDMKMRRLEMTAGRFRTLVMQHLRFNRIPITQSTTIASFDAIGIWTDREEIPEQPDLLEQVSYRWEENGIYFYCGNRSRKWFGLYFNGWNKGWTIYYTTMEYKMMGNPRPKIQKLSAKDYTELQRRLMQLDKGSNRVPLYGDGSRFYQLFILAIGICLGFVHIVYAGDILIRLLQNGHSPFAPIFSTVQSLFIGVILVLYGFYFLKLSCKVLKKNFEQSGRSEKEYLNAKNKKRKTVSGIFFVFTVCYCIAFSLVHGCLYRWELICMKPLQTIVIPLILAFIASILLYKSVKYEMNNRK